jgi:hypothetical protein
MRPQIAVPAYTQMGAPDDAKSAAVFRFFFLRMIPLNREPAQRRLLCSLFPTSLFSYRPP